MIIKIHVTSNIKFRSLRLREQSVSTLYIGSPTRDLQPHF